MDKLQQFADWVKIRLTALFGKGEKVTPGFAFEDYKLSPGNDYKIVFESIDRQAFARFQRVMERTVNAEGKAIEVTAVGIFNNEFWVTIHVPNPIPIALGTVIAALISMAALLGAGTFLLKRVEKLVSNPNTLLLTALVAAAIILPAFARRN